MKELVNLQNGWTSPGDTLKKAMGFICVYGNWEIFYIVLYRTAQVVHCSIA